MENKPATTGKYQEDSRDDNGRIKPGFSGNPKGRPKGTKNFTVLVREALKQVGKFSFDGLGKQEMTYETAMALRLVRKATLDGDLPTAKLIWNYLEGMPKQTIENTGDETEADRDKLRDIHRILTNGQETTGGKKNS